MAKKLTTYGCDNRVPSLTIDCQTAISRKLPGLFCAIWKAKEAPSDSQEATVVQLFERETHICVKTIVPWIVFKIISPIYVCREQKIKTNLAYIFPCAFFILQTLERKHGLCQHIVLELFDF